MPIANSIHQHVRHLDERAAKRVSLGLPIGWVLLDKKNRLSERIEVRTGDCGGASRGFGRGRCGFQRGSCISSNTPTTTPLPGSSTTIVRGRADPVPTLPQFRRSSDPAFRTPPPNHRPGVATWPTPPDSVVVPIANGSRRGSSVFGKTSDGTAVARGHRRSARDRLICDESAAAIDESADP